MYTRDLLSFANGISLSKRREEAHTPENIATEKSDTDVTVCTVLDCLGNMGHGPARYTRDTHDILSEEASPSLGSPTPIPVQDPKPTPQSEGKPQGPGRDGHNSKESRLKNNTNMFPATNHHQYA